ncbi:MAG TPA: 16S rRNA (uracil(1498)-N(3))-methyltransferase, partial [Halieaceae bacterium]|nr:16S rRNA (uracil(1498)-N(3))-methyltransferase [Halieaceae bacterium]
LVVIGPEGGFIPYEVEKLREAGCEAVSLGPRILRVENALTSLLGRLF